MPEARVYLTQARRGGHGRDPRPRGRRAARRRARGTTSACARTPACGRPGSSRDPAAARSGPRRHLSPAQARRAQEAAQPRGALGRPRRLRRRSPCSSASGSGAPTRSARAATSPRCSRSRSARTRSSTRRTTRCSARSRPSGTASPSRSTRSTRGWRRRRSRSRTAASASHGGVDPQGIARAVWADVQSGEGSSQGGSTITQQLVRNLYISQERTFSRKLKEVCLAIKLSHAWTKERILAAYMNQVYYGNHAYGIEAAAQTYFSKHAKNLTPGAVRAARRPAAGAVRVRPVHRAAEGASRAGTRCSRRCSRTATSRRPSTRRRWPTATSASSRGASTRASASRTSSATCATS